VAKGTTLKNNLPKVAKDSEKKAAQLVERTAYLVESKTKENLVKYGAVDTGNLLNSFQSVKLGPLKWGVGSHVEYAPHVEYGTAKMPGRPALTEALADDQVKKNFSKTLSMIFKP
jgi:HK97 gp10 family phage protein